jgi:hypothetical protein
MYNQNYDNQQQIHLAAPSMTGKEIFFVKLKVNTIGTSLIR